MSVRLCVNSIKTYKKLSTCVKIISRLAFRLWSHSSLSYYSSSYFKLYEVYSLFNTDIVCYIHTWITCYDATDHLSCHIDWRIARVIDISTWWYFSRINALVSLNKFCTCYRVCKFQIETSNPSHRCLSIISATILFIETISCHLTNSKLFHYHPIFIIQY